MSKNHDHTTENLLDYLYHPKYHKLICIDLARQTNISIRQQIKFVGKLEEGLVKQCFLFLKSSKKLF